MYGALVNKILEILKKVQYACFIVDLLASIKLLTILKNLAFI